MRSGHLFAAALGAALVVAGPSFADPPHCPPGHAKKGWCGDDRGHAPGWVHRDDDDRWEDRDRDRDDWVARQRAYEQGYRDGLRDAWRIGERLPRDRYRVVPDFYEYGWPAPASGRVYAEADGRYYLINLATGLILDVLTR